MFSALRHKNFRLFFVGQGLSLLGTWMQMPALAWFIWELTGRKTSLGTIWFAAQIPNLLLAPVAGVLADRHPRKRILYITQTLAMLQAFALAGMTLAGEATYAHVIVLAAWLGIVNAFDMPTRQAFVVEMIEREDLGNAIALNSFVFNGARIIGPPIAGLLIGLIGPGNIFLINGLSFLAVLWALFQIRPLRTAPVEHTDGFVANIVEGFRFASHHLILRDLLLFLGVISFMGLPYQVLMPAIADEDLGGGPEAFGFLMAAIGLGSLGGAFLVMRGFMSERLELLVPLAGMGFGLGLAAFSFSDNFWLSIAILFPAGGVMMMQTLGTNTSLQKHVPDRIRGRVMSLYTMMLLGLYPIGSQFMGVLADRIGSLEAVRFGGACIFLVGCFVLLRVPRIRESALTLTKMNEDEEASGIKSGPPPRPPGREKRKPALARAGNGACAPKESQANERTSNL